jgi:hypothetical protein
MMDVDTQNKKRQSHNKKRPISQVWGNILTRALKKKANI